MKVRILLGSLASARLPIGLDALQKIMHTNPSGLTMEIIRTRINCSSGIHEDLDVYGLLPDSVVNGFPCCPLQSPSSVDQKINCVRCEPATYVSMTQEISDGVQILTIKPSGF